MEKATIYDFARMCNHYRGNIGCMNCPLYTELFNGKMERCYNHIALYTDSANDKIIGWCKEHPAKTRQDKFLELFPNATVEGGVLRLCPTDIDNGVECTMDCDTCSKEYWLAEEEK